MKYEYCQVHTDYTTEQIGDTTVSIHKGVIAKSSKGIIATSKYYLDIFNQLGDEGWIMCGQIISGIRLHVLDNHEPKVLQTDIIYYLERQID